MSVKDLKNWEISSAHGLKESISLKCSTNFIASRFVASNRWCLVFQPINCSKAIFNLGYAKKLLTVAMYEEKKINPHDINPYGLRFNYLYKLYSSGFQ